MKYISYIYREREREREMLDLVNPIRSEKISGKVDYTQ